MGKGQKLYSGISKIDDVDKLRPLMETIKTAKDTVEIEELHKKP